MKKKIEKKIGILGGSFDPAHKGHLKISIEAKKKFGINKIIWAITKKNPFKKKSKIKLITIGSTVNKKLYFLTWIFYNSATISTTSWE